MGVSRVRVMVRLMVRLMVRCDGDGERVMIVMVKVDGEVDGEV